MIQNLLPYDPHHLEALLGRYRVDDHVAMYPNEVLAVEYSVLILSSSIDDLHGEVLISIANDFAESVFDCRVVRIDEVSVDVLDREGALAW